MKPASGDYERAEKAFTHGLAEENFNPAKAHIKKALEQRLGHRRAEPYLITALEPIAGTRYSRFGLDLPPKAIEIGDEAGGSDNTV